MNQANSNGLPKVDMSPEAIDRRLRELDQLYELGSSLQRAKKIGKVASPPPPIALPMPRG
jgi:hypothetical protein